MLCDVIEVQGGYRIREFIGVYSGKVLTITWDSLFRNKAKAEAHILKIGGELARPDLFKALYGN